MQSEETCDLLATRKRLAGVERRTAPEQLDVGSPTAALPT
jgi:hypothetical protein